MVEYFKTLFSCSGQNHVAMGSAGQERPQEAAAGPHPGDGAEGRARAAGAQQRRARARARGAPRAARAAPAARRLG